MPVSEKWQELVIARLEGKEFIRETERQVKKRDSESIPWSKCKVTVRQAL